MKVKVKKIFWFIFSLVCIIIEADVINCNTDSKKLDDNRLVLKFYKNSTLSITGSLLKLSDIPFKEERINNSMPNIGQIIKIFATEKLIIDCDINEIGDEMNIVFIAPLCQVDGLRIINLDGNSAAVNQILSEKNGTINNHSNNQGENQKLTNGNGGNFYGICQNFINAENLSISANKAASKFIDKNGTNFSKNGKNGTKENFECYYDSEKTVNGKNGTQKNFKCQNGTNGKNGTLENYKCQNGTNGKNGTEDKGKCKNGTQENFKCQNETNGKNGTFEHKNGIEGLEPTANVREGEIIIIILENPEKKYPKMSPSNFSHDFQKMDKFNFLQVLNDFNFFAQSSYFLNSTKNITNFHNFHQNLLKNVKNFSPILQFIDEFINLEKFYYRFNENRSIIIDSYKSLQDRLNNYSGDKIEKQIPNEENILKHLSENLSVRIENLTTNFQTDENLNQLVKILTKRKENREKVSQLQEVLSTKLFLEQNFIRIKNFLSNEVQGKIDKFTKNVNEKIDDLICNLDENNNLKSRKQLENLIQEKFSLHTIYLIKLAIEFTLPMVFILFFKNFYQFSNSRENFPFNDVEEFYENIYLNYNNYAGRRILILAEHINFIDEKKLENGKLRESLGSLRGKLMNLFKNLTSSYWIKKEIFKSEIEILLGEERKLNSLSENNKISLDIIQKLKIDLKFAQIFGESYKQFLNITEIHNIINNMTDKFDYIEEKQQKLYEEVFPDLNTLRKEFLMTEEFLQFDESNPRNRLLIFVSGFLNEIYMETSSVILRDWHNGSYDIFSINLRKTAEDIQEMLLKLLGMRKIAKDKNHMASDPLMNYKLSLLTLYQEDNYIVDYYLKILAKFKENNFYDKEFLIKKKNWSKNFLADNWGEIFDSTIEQIERNVDVMIRKNVTDKSGDKIKNL
ncbi:uncharacterized protein MAL13P1.304-like [Leptopilina heterotoma]|uniref:uncharacterized protein MAL13P1.304-like n=1 Tax=Leptopilina heterotoma TaxID=63436 RepID=UPI001CA917E3|nr:uncharacterized protein MAL13P1.304-like [Leptopilina heterotoma]